MSRSILGIIRHILPIVRHHLSFYADGSNGEGACLERRVMHPNASPHHRSPEKDIVEVGPDLFLRP